MDKALVLCELGRGGMGTVFLAAEFGFGAVRKLQVIKRVSPSLLESADQIRAFVHEARLSTAFRHPNVVQTLGLTRTATAASFAWSSSKGSR